MLHIRTSQFRWLLMLVLGLWAVAAQAGENRYRYVSLNPGGLPEGFFFDDPRKVTNSGQIYGTVFECRPVDTCEEVIPHVGVHADGVVTVLQHGLVTTANERGTIGGGVLLDPVNFTTQAALFRGSSVELIPPQPGEYTSEVFALNDRDVALVHSYDALFQRTCLLYSHGRSTPVSQCGVMNNHGTIAGTKFVGGVYRGYRFDPRTGIETTLNPIPPDPHAWGLGINSRSHVLGYSFVFGGRERIGVWDRAGVFRTHFIEGIPEFPTISNSLRFNDKNWIVITFVTNPPSERGNSYLVPRPGVRLNLADVTENLPPFNGALFFVRNLNNRGDIVGFGSAGAFLLKRLDDETAKGNLATIASSEPIAQSDLRNTKKRLCRMMQTQAHLAMTSLERPGAKASFASLCQ